MTRSRTSARRGQRPEGGVALVSTLILIILGIFAGASLMAAAASEPIGRTDDSYAAALGAAARCRRPYLPANPLRTNLQDRAEHLAVRERG